MDSNPPQPPPSENADSPDVLDSPPTAPWRRPLLVLAGLSLLAVGAAINADRLPLPLQTPSESPELEAGKSSMQAEEASQGQRHKGEEGRMGRAPSQRKTGYYALKGPQDVAPRAAMRVGQGTQAHNAGVLGMMQQESGHFLASPYGGSFAVGRDGEDVWGGGTGPAVGTPYGVPGVGFDRSAAQGDDGRVALNGFVETLVDPKSTFSIDVDTASYANVRRHLLESGQAPAPAAVRTEEMINYFDYNYIAPNGDAPFSVTTEVGPAPWDASHRVVHIGVQGKTVDAADIPPRNLVFLVDVSGSMSSPDKLGLVKKGLSALAAQMNGQDRISVVVYAGAAGAVLAPTSGADQQAIADALNRLESGGGTNGSEGIHLAYELAQQSFIKGGVNRVLIATDGDFNVGTTDHLELMELIESKRKTGVFLSVLGVGSGSFNDPMMEQLADKGNGNYAYLDSEFEARKVLVEESGAMLQTIAKDVKIQVEFDPDQVLTHRLIGYENRVLAHRDFDDDTKDAGEIGAGHTVTALYEVAPAPGAGDDPLMMLNLRYKDPDGDQSKRISVPVSDEGRKLAESSANYRFSAAVAMLGQKLRGHEAQTETTYGEIVELAWESAGSDPYCYRHQFVQLAAKAGSLAGEPVDFDLPACHAESPPPRKPQPTPAAEFPDDTTPTTAVGMETQDEEEPFDWRAFVIEALRMLPPLLALPFFVIAFWRPRRRHRGSL